MVFSKALERGANINAYYPGYGDEKCGKTALMLAIEFHDENRAQCVKALINAKPNLSQKPMASWDGEMMLVGKSAALGIAIEAQKPLFAKLLINAGANARAGVEALRANCRNSALDL